MDFSREELELIRKVLNGTENETAWKLAMRKWKKNCRQERRAKEKAQMNGITQDEDGYDEETCTPVKYQKDKNMTDWSGPHDGYWRGDPKEIAEDLFDGKIWKAEDK